MQGGLDMLVQNGQLQIIVGTEVKKYHDEIQELLSNKPQNMTQKTVFQKNLTSRFMDTVSGVFGPIVPAIDLVWLLPFRSK
ncbi:MAG: PTS system beta-glucosides-specific IIC component [Psychromonas sp.]